MNDDYSAEKQPTADIVPLSLLAFIVGAFIVLGIQLLGFPPSPIETIDIDQHRLDLAAAIPDNRLTLSQTFTPQKGGLTSITLLAVRFTDRSQAEDGRLTLSLFDAANGLVAEQSYVAAEVEHNSELVFRFPPQWDSAETQYTLTLTGTNNQSLTVWSYSLDTHAGGAFVQSDGETEAADLRFSTQYRLGARNLLGNLLREMRWALPIGLATLLVLPLPGLLAIVYLRFDEWDYVSAAVAALGLGMSGWALLWLWLSAVGIPVTETLLLLLLGAGWGAFIAGQLFINDLPPRPLTLKHLPLLLLVGFGLALRLLAVRDIEFLPWVDATRHALITSVLVSDRMWLTDYQPFLDVGYGTYHYGFHTLPATMLQMFNFDLNTLLLGLAQWLNALIPLAVYTGVWLLRRRRLPALIAAFLVTIPFFFPAFYTSWGRLTQLMGMLLLPPLMGLTWEMAYGRRTRQLDWVTAVLTAGLFLVHFRVLLLFVVWVLMLWIVKPSRRIVSGVATMAVAILLVVPQLVRLTAFAEPTGLVSQISGYNQLPTAYYAIGWERLFVGGAAAAVLIALVAFVRRADWSQPVLLLALWVALMFALLNSSWLGLPETWVINMNSMVITLFFPIAAVIGLVAAEIWWWLQQQSQPIRLTGAAAAGGIFSTLLLFGVMFQINMINDRTVFAKAADADALRWAAELLPADAVVANSAWLWLGDTYAGEDGAAWLLPLTGLQTTTPPADYIYDLELSQRVNAFNEASAAIDDWSTAASAEFLRSHGVTHLYVGARGGQFKPEQLEANAELRRLYAQDGVFIYEIAQ